MHPGSMGFSSKVYLLFIIDVVKLFFAEPPFLGEIYKFPCLPLLVAATQSKKSIPRSTPSKRSATSAIPNKCLGFSKSKNGTQVLITLYNVSLELYDPPIASALKCLLVNFAQSTLRSSNIPP